MVLISKIITGEEVIGEVTEIGDSYKIKNPCAIAFVPSRDQPGQQSLGLIPYAAYTKTHAVVIKKDHVIWQEELAPEVYNQYNAVFGSGIQIVGGSIPPVR